MAKGEFSDPDHKLVKLRSQLQEALGIQLMPARKFASLIGKIISMFLALGPVTRLMTRSLYVTLNNRIARFHKLLLTPKTLEELTFWFNEVTKFNGQHTWPKSSTVRVVCSDASFKWFGG